MHCFRGTNWELMVTCCLCICFLGPLLEKDSPTCNEDLVLLDARNLYETRIGKFHAPNVETLDPGIRQYSDLPSWIDDKYEQLKGKRVLM